MDWIVFFGCILTSELKDDFSAAWMFGNEFGHVVDIAVEDYPAAVFASVLGDCFVDGGDQPFGVVRRGRKVQVRLPSS